MNTTHFSANRTLRNLHQSCAVILLASSLSLSVNAQLTNSPAVLKISADQVAAKVSPKLYGLMTEEINYSYDGGLYAELVRNRTFKWNTNNPIFWQLVHEGDSVGAMLLDADHPLNDALTLSLKLEIAKADRKHPVGIANEGFWGIPVRPKTKYHASFFARTDKNFRGPLTVEIVSTNGATVFASETIRKVSGDWKKYEVTLKTGNVAPTKDALLRITTTKPGTVWFSCVSLFPPTYNNRANGNRPDIMQLLADMHPQFLRFPGGNYVEGSTIPERFDWKKTLGPISERPGHRSPWGYLSTDGMGLLEFLEWCEDLHMQPVLAVYAGYSLRGQHVNPGADLQPFVQEALDEIEYVTGDTGTTWGARRAKDGHPAPFKLEYVEIGNEDWFDRSRSYDDRFAQFFDAIKAKYPKIQCIATAPIKSRTPDVIDDHFYRNSMQMQSDTHHYDKTDRNGPKIFVGEWATREGSPTPNMNAALGDAAWMTGMERNSDIVIMHCYAPLFVNVSQLGGNGRSMQWSTDLIGYDALTSYGSPAYYAQVMFSQNHGDVVLPVDSQNIPTRVWQPPISRRGGVTNTPPMQDVPTIFYNATRDTKSGAIFLKVVNTGGDAQKVQIEITGAPKIKSDGEAIVLSAPNPENTNTITDPKHIVPVTSKVNGIGGSFTREFPPYSITVLRIAGK
jgi:alpha-N-arabinofuranosidase